MTNGHDIGDVTVHLRDGKSWTYIQCSCGTETFTEEWEFTDHIRRLVFDALKDASAVGSAVGPTDPDS